MYKHVQIIHHKYYLFDAITIKGIKIHLKLMINIDINLNNSFAL